MAIKLKSILMATDGSEFSVGAQRVAIALAKRRGARLTAMTIILSTQDLEGVGTHGLREQMERTAQATLDAVVAAACFWAASPNASWNRRHAPCW